MLRMALIAAVLLVGWLSAAPAAARTLWGRSTTYARGFVQPAGEGRLTHLPFYELLELHSANLGPDGLSVHTQVWGMVDALDLQDTSRVSGDVNTLFLRYRLPGEGKLSFLHGLELVAGRQFVALGPTLMEQLDGGKLHYLHSTGVELGVFGGAPTGLRMIRSPWPSDDDEYEYGYNWIIGGRLGYVNMGWLSGGVSFAHRRYDGLVADSDLGGDLSYSPLRWLDLSGDLTFSLEAERIKQARGSVALRPWRRWSFALGYRYSSPDLWIPRSSIFAVFSEESFQEAFADTRWRATRRLSLEAGYGRRFYGGHEHDSADAGDHTDLREGANRAVLRASYRPAFAEGARLVAEVGRLESPDNAANRLRLASTLPLPLFGRTFQLVADVDFFVLDEPLRESRVSLVASAYVEAPLRSGLRLLAGGSGGVSPLMQNIGSFTVRLTWDFELAGGKPGKATPPLVRVRRGGLI